MRYCEEYAALLDQYADGELSKQDSAGVRAHLEGCPGCRAYVESVLAIRASFPDAEETAVPEGFAESVMAAVRMSETVQEKEAVSRPRRRPYWNVLLPLAACFAIVLAVRYGPYQGGGINAADNAAPAAMDTAVPVGGVDDVSASGGEAPYDLAAASPQVDADLFQEESGHDVAPALRMVPDEPAASVEDALNENAPEVEAREKIGMTMASGEQLPAPRVIRLTAEQTGKLLADLPYTTGEDGARCYQLTNGEFNALLEALAERDIIPERQESAPELEILSQGYDLVYVTEE